eukprot:562224-Rhodomonas_salina.4
MFDLGVGFMQLQVRRLYVRVLQQRIHRTQQPKMTERMQREFRVEVRGGRVLGRPCSPHSLWHGAVCGVSDIVFER